MKPSACLVSGIAGLALWLATAVHAAAPVAFETLDGAPATVESHLGGGRWTVVKIWVSSCHVCNIEAENYAQFHEEQGSDGIRVLGLSMDGSAGRDAARAYVARHDLPFANLLGEPLAVSAYYTGLTQQSLLGTPTFLLFDPQGELCAAQAGALATEAIVRYVEERSREAAEP